MWLTFHAALPCSATLEKGYAQSKKPIACFPIKVIMWKVFCRELCQQAERSAITESFCHTAWQGRACKAGAEVLQVRGRGHEAGDAVRAGDARAQAEDADGRYQGPHELVLHVAVGVRLGGRPLGAHYAHPQQRLQMTGTLISKSSR